MQKHPYVISVAILFCALTINAQQQPTTSDGFEFKPDQSVYLIAIRTSEPPDAQIRRLLAQAGRVKMDQRSISDNSRRTNNPAPPPDNRPRLDRPVSERVTLERSITEPDTLTSTDLALKSKLEEEFKKRKKFKVADSVETADFVFFTISRYSSLIVQVRPQGITAAGIVGEAYGDNLMSLVAFAIPASTYRRTKKDFNELGHVAQWEGAEVGRVTIDASAGRREHSANNASVRELIEKFHKDALKKKAADDHVKTRSPLSVPDSLPPSTGVENRQPAPATTEQDLVRKPSSDAPQSSVTVKLETSLVVIPVSVLDSDGKYIPNLSQRDFHIYEDNVEQEIDHFSSVEAPFHVVLLLDTSGSVRFKTDDIQDAAFTFLEQLNPQDRVMVICFDSRIYLNSEFTSDRTQVRRGLYGLRTRGGTRLYDAIDLALTERLKQIQGRKAIVLFTDGVDTESRLTSASRTLELVEESGALVYSVRYDTSLDAEKGARMFGPPDNRIHIPNSTISGPEAYERAAQYLAALTERAGGRLYRAENLSNLSQSLSLIAEELRHQYAISYYPINTTRDGTYRRIRVTVSQPNVVVRARAGYRAASLASIRETPPLKGTARP